MIQTSKRSTAPIYLLFIFLASGILFTIIKTNTSQARKPNILWIVVDSLRADHLGCYNYKRPTSPFMDEFAAQNLLFNYAFSQESYTQASVASYFTSTYPWENKVLYDNPAIDILDQHFITMAEILKEANYNTAAFTFNPHMKARLNFGQGFDLYDDHKEDLGTALPKYETHETAKKIFDKVKSYLEEVGNKRPVFLYLHYRDTHKPYVPPPPYDKIFFVPTKGPVAGEEAQAVEKGIEFQIAQYDGEIRYVDDYIRKTLKMLEGYRINKMNSIIIITADHGEEFYDYHPGDPGFVSHGRTLYNEQIRVPLIMAIPGVYLEKKTVDTYVGLIDIAPTLCDILKINWRKYGQFRGRSLLPVIKGDSRAFFAIYGGGRYGRGYIIGKKYKYYMDVKDKISGFERPINNDYVMREEFYDLKADFNETKDLFGERADIAAKLKRKLKASMKKTGAKAGGGKSAELDAQTREELKSLGYLQ